MINESPLSKINPSGNERFTFGGDSCWRMIIADGCLTDDKYYKGLGGPYYSCIHAFCLGGAERKLVYYKKGGVTWGSPLIVTGISDNTKTKKIMIYPNPATSTVNIIFSNCSYQDSYIYIYNIQGQLQKAMHLVSNNSLINISDLSSGIYILKITDNESILKMDKLVIE